LALEGGNGLRGAEIVSDLLQSEIFSEQELTKAKTRLVTVPKTVIRGLGQALQVPSARTSTILPNFVIRGCLVNNIKRIEQADNFLINQEVDLQSIKYDKLSEACSARLINSSSRSEEELRMALAQWLELTVVQPKAKIKETGLHYNGNLARTILLCYNAVDGARDERSSYLPRLLYQGQ